MYLLRACLIAGCVSLGGHSFASELASPPLTMKEKPETRCVVHAAEFHKVNPWILRAIIQVESGFNPKAYNRNSNGTVDIGMGQINSIHFRELGKYGIAPNHLMDSCVATYVSAWHLAKQIKVHGNTWFGVAAYHSTSSCFNSRYQGLLWNQLVKWKAVNGNPVRVKSLAQCGYVAPRSHAKSKTSQEQTAGSVLAFDHHD